MDDSITINNQSMERVIKSLVINVTGSQGGKLGLKFYFLTLNKTLGERKF